MIPVTIIVLRSSGASQSHCQPNLSQCIAITANGVTSSMALIVSKLPNLVRLYTSSTGEVRLWVGVGSCNGLCCPQEI